MRTAAAAECSPRRDTLGRAARSQNTTRTPAPPSQPVLRKVNSYSRYFLQRTRCISQIGQHSQVQTAAAFTGQSLQQSPSPCPCSQRQGSRRLQEHRSSSRNLCFKQVPSAHNLTVQQQDWPSTSAHISLSYFASLNIFFPLQWVPPVPHNWCYSLESSVKTQQPQNRQRQLSQAVLQAADGRTFLFHARRECSYFRWKSMGYCSGMTVKRTKTKNKNQVSVYPMMNEIHCCIFQYYPWNFILLSVWTNVLTWEARPHRDILSYTQRCVSKV